MTKDEDAFYRVSADFENRDDAERFKAQIENMQSVGPLTMLTGDSSNDAIASIATALTSKKQIAERRDRIVDFYTMDDTIDIANTIRDQNVREIDVIAALVCRNANNERAIESLRCDLADLRAAQSLADPAGAHPYRAAAAPSRPVAASEAPPTRAWSSGAWRHVYGTLRWAPAAGAGLLAIGFVHQSVTAPDSALFRAAALGMLIASLAGLVGALVLAWRVTRAARAGVER